MFLLEICSTLHCLLHIFYMNNHRLILNAMFAETISRRIVTMENISKKTLNNLLVQSSRFPHFRHNLKIKKPNLIAILSSYHSLELYLPKFMGPCDFLPFFLINVFQMKSLLLREGLQKNPVFWQHSAFSYMGLLLASAECFGRGFFCPKILEKKSSVFLNIRNMRFDQSSPG